MELTEIEAFVQIADSTTFTQAARNLGISQPAISRRIELLESDLDTRLFERLVQGAQLTDAGRAFLPYARRILADVRDGTSAVRELSDSPSGDVVLAMVGTLASSPLLDQLGAFRTAFPHIRLHIRTATSDVVGRLVATGEAQLGVRYFEDSSPSIIQARVANERLVITCAATASVPEAPIESPQALAGIPWVTFPTGVGSSGEPFARMMERALVTFGLHESSRIEIDSLTAQKRMIEAGFGCGLIQESAIADEVRIGSLRTLDIPGFDATVPIYLLSRRGGFETPAMRALRDLLSPNDGVNFPGWDCSP